MGMSAGGHGEKAVPYINVTPLIDVLLVLLIIFMVVTPLKPSRFKALIPEPPKPDEQPSEPSAIQVSLVKDYSACLRIELRSRPSSPVPKRSRKPFISRHPGQSITAGLRK